MTKDGLMKRLVAISVLCALGWGTVAAAAQGSAAEASHTIRVLSASGDASTPQAALWKKAPKTLVTLQTAFPGHVAIVGVANTQSLSAQAIRAAGRLFVKLAWSDSSANTEIKDTDKFLDGAAVEFPVNVQAATLPYMGDTTNAVNIWQWRADGRTLNLLAKGFGTSTPVPIKGLTSVSTRINGGWEVVLSRPLRVSSEEGANLEGRRTTPIGFAAWNGENQERDGFKAVTMEWWQLRF